MAAAGLPPQVHHATQTYGDADGLRLVDATATRLDQTREQVLQDFGEFLLPDLMRVYGSLADPKWRTLEFLENVEHTIHRGGRHRHSLWGRFDDDRT